MKYRQWLVDPNFILFFLPADIIFYRYFMIGTFDVTNVAIGTKIKRKIKLVDETTDLNVYMKKLC